MHELGIEMTWPDPKKQYGSSDIGNVSIKIPAIHDYLSITDDASIQAHTVEYTEAAASPEAQEVCLKGAKGLAMTAYDILSNPEFQKEIRNSMTNRFRNFIKNNNGIFLMTAGEGGNGILSAEILCPCGKI